VSKKTFVVYYQGSGGGCDYTLGCNLRVETIYANDLAGAERLVREALFEDDDSVNYAEKHYASITIYEVCCVTRFDLDGEIDRVRRVAKAEQDASQDRCERSEYERLKTKFDRKV
jgi:hypothetical protein